LKIEFRLPERVVVHGVDKRSVNSLAWCAATYGINRLFWLDGYLICTEVFEKSFEHEIEKSEFHISQVCYSSFPKYTRTYEVEKATQVPIVDVSEMKIYRSLLEEILNEQPGDHSQPSVTAKEP